MPSPNSPKSERRPYQRLCALFEEVTPRQLRQTIRTLFFHCLLPEESPPPTPDQIRDIQLLLEFLDEVERR